MKLTKLLEPLHVTPPFLYDPEHELVLYDSGDGHQLSLQLDNVGDDNAVVALTSFFDEYREKWTRSEHTCTVCGLAPVERDGLTEYAMTCDAVRLDDEKDIYLSCEDFARQNQFEGGKGNLLAVDRKTYLNWLREDIASYIRDERQRHSKATRTKKKAPVAKVPEPSYSTQTVVKTQASKDKRAAKAPAKGKSKAKVVPVMEPTKTIVKKERSLNEQLDLLRERKNLDMEDDELLEAPKYDPYMSLADLMEKYETNPSKLTKGEKDLLRQVGVEI